MKMVIFAVFLLAFFASSSLSQEYVVDKESFIISGTGSFTSQGGDLYEVSGERTTLIVLASAVNYFIVPHLFLGGVVEYTGWSEKHWRSSSISIGPAIGYAIGGAKSTVYPYLTVGFRYRWWIETYKYGRYKETETSPATDVILGAGVIFPVVKHVGLIVEAGYHIQNMKPEGADKWTSGNILGVNIGIAGLLF